MKAIDWCIETGKCDQLTQKQLIVLRLMMDGLTNEDVAVEMELSTKTVKAHMTLILKRYGQPSRAALIVFFTNLYIAFLERELKARMPLILTENGVAHGTAQGR